MPAPSLSTPAARIEARDIATSVFVEESNRLQDNDAGISAAAGAIRDLGFLVTVDVRNGAASFASITVTACDGSSIVLDWEPCAEGFEYEGSGDDACDLGEDEAQHEAEPEPEPEPEPKTIDVTPTWASLIPMLAHLIEQGGEPRRIAIAALYRLAEFADAENARNRK
jgi:hypothetical protein